MNIKNVIFKFFLKKWKKMVANGKNILYTILTITKNLILSRRKGCIRAIIGCLWTIVVE